MKTAALRVEDRSRMDPAKVVSVRLDDLLSVLDLKLASILRAEAQEKMKTGMPFGAKSKIEAKTGAKNRKRIK